MYAFGILFSFWIISSVLGGREMGLWVSQKIISMHQVLLEADYSIWIELLIQGQLGICLGEDDGEGTTFYFDLPLYLNSKQTEVETSLPLPSESRSYRAIEITARRSSRTITRVRDGDNEVDDLDDLETNPSRSQRFIRRSVLQSSC